MPLHIACPGTHSRRCTHQIVHHNHCTPAPALAVKLCCLQGSNLEAHVKAEKYWPSPPGSCGNYTARKRTPAGVTAQHVTPRLATLSKWGRTMLSILQQSHSAESLLKPSSRSNRLRGGGHWLAALSHSQSIGSIDSSRQSRQSHSMRCRCRARGMWKRGI
jgi:hypothetical protein